MPASENFIYIGCDLLHRYDRACVEDEDGDKVYLNEGECSYQLLDSEGEEVTAGDMPHVAGSTKGRYQATIDREVTRGLEPGAEYTLVTTFSQDGNDDERRVVYTAAYRT